MFLFLHFRYQNIKVELMMFSCFFYLIDPNTVWWKLAENCMLLMLSMATVEIINNMLK